MDFMLSDKAVEAYKRIHKEEHGENLNDETALKLATNFLIIFDKVYHPIKKTWADKLNEKTKK